MQFFGIIVVQYIGWRSPFGDGAHRLRNPGSATAMYVIYQQWSYLFRMITTTTTVMATPMPKAITATRIITRESDITKCRGYIKFLNLQMESDSNICGQLRIENFLGEEVSYPEGYGVADLVKFWINYRHPRPNFLHFFAVFAEMWSNNRLAPSLWGWASISGKSWIRH